MRRSLLASLVLLHFLIFSEVQGIRLGKGISVFGVQTIHEEEGSNNGNTVGNGDGTVACKNGECTGILKMTRRLSTSCTSSSKSRVAMKPHHSIPSIHEDYYGPTHHQPNHH